uniref:Zinc finger protein 1 n=1 Tax=Strigamia maritima TaxID=126957 RepID=T1JG32_STRMM
MISHDESAVLRKFKCPECEKAFKFKHHLKEHIRIHSGEKPFACPNCGKRFSHSGSYSSHMTSKKCLVMNLKVRRTIEKPNMRGNGVTPAGTTGGGGGGGRRGSSQGAFTPILPKYGENGLELSPGYGAPPCLSVGDHYATAGIDFVPHSMQAFLPPPYGLHPLLTGNHHHHFSNSGLSMYAGLAPPPPSLAALSHVIRPSAIAVKANEDGRDSSQIQQRDPAIPSLAAISPHPESDDAGKAFRAQSPEESSSSSDLKAVKQILATVNATVSKQQQEMNKLRNGISAFNQSVDGDRSTPSPTTSRTDSPVNNNNNNNNNNSSTALSPRSPNVNAATDSGNVKRNGYRGGDDSHCRHCGNSFESKIDLHQHERYLCKMNREIFPASNNRGEITNNELMNSCFGDRVNHGITNGYSDMDDDPPISDIEDGCRDMGEEGLDGDGRKVRMRSLFSEEQQSVLRSYYEANARPGKEELERIAVEIKFNRRVVQVWFQNMRARDKKRGRAMMGGKDSMSAISSWYGDSSPPPSQQLMSSSQHAKTPFSAISPTSSSYGVTSMNGSLLASRIPHPPIFYPTPSPSPFSLPSAPSRLNGQSSSPPSFAAPPFPLDHEQPLDLSVKGSSHKSHNNNSCHSPAVSDQSISDGEVLNLSQKSSRTSTPSKESNNNVNYAAVTTSGALSGLGSHLNHHDHNALLKATEPSAIFKYMMATPKMELDDLSAGEDTPDLIVMRRNFSGSPNACDTPRLHRILASSPHLDVSSLNGTVDSSGRVYSTDGSHSPCLSDHDDHLEIDEGSDIHRRCWTKADHGDESQLDLDDSSMGEDDRPLKRRKSWKQHKLDSEDGMYACDQCDKVFSKQSSLARHKYEHSGQRPHKCDVCSKAFKHKHHLTEHKRLHSGEKPFQCKKCLKRFSHSGSYSQHMNHRYSYCKPYRE